MNLGMIVREVGRHVKIPVIPVSRIGGELHTPEDLIEAVKIAESTT